MAKIACHKCGDDMEKIEKKGNVKYLGRKNGGPWECRPACDGRFASNDATTRPS